MKTNKAIVLFLGVFCICCASLSSSRKEETLKFSVLNTYLYSVDTIYVKITNPTTTNFFLPIDFYHKKFNPNFNSRYNRNFYPSIIVKEQPYSEIMITSSTDLVLRDHDPFEKMSDFTLIDAGLTVKIKIPFSNREILPNHKLSYIDRGLTKGVYRVYLEYEINKNDVESTINPELLNLLYEKGYQCYDGTITSNVVKLVVE